MKFPAVFCVLFSRSVVLVFLFASTSCATYGPSISDIVEEKKGELNVESNSLDVNLLSYGKYVRMTLYVDKDDRPQYLCNAVSCDNSVGKEDVLAIPTSRNGFVKPVLRSTEKVCGIGTWLGGWWPIFKILEPFSKRDIPEEQLAINFSNRNSEICNARERYIVTNGRWLNSVEHWLAASGFVVLSGGTSLITTIGLSRKQFSVEKYNSIIRNGDLDAVRRHYYSEFKTDGTDNGIVPIVYVDINDFGNSFEDAYKLIDGGTPIIGLMFLNKDTNEFLSAVNFRNYRKEGSVGSAVAKQIKKIRNTILHREAGLSYSDIEKRVPRWVRRPGLPPVPRFTKNEYETTKAYKTRFMKAMAIRDDVINASYKNYKNEVDDRNRTIASLEKQFQNYLKKRKKKEEKLVKKFDNAVVELGLLLYKANNQFYADSFQYDADKKKLYFTLNSMHWAFRQRVVAHRVPAEFAKIIKRGGYKIVEKLGSKRTKIKVKGYKLIELKSKREFKVSFTDVEYMPESIELYAETKARLTGEEEQQELRQTFKRLTQIPDDFTNVTIVNELNKKRVAAPDWYLKACVGYVGCGQGYSQEDAMNVALADLAKVIGVEVSSSSGIYIEMADASSISTYREDATVNARQRHLTYQDYEKSKVKQKNGVWYVVLK